VSITPKVEVREKRKEEAMATGKDLVCGMDIDPDTAAAKEEYKGKTYYFCSEVCHEKFKAEPERYAK